MKHDNLVVIDIYYGSSKKSFYVRGFSHSINDVSTQFERKIMIDGPDTELQLFAIPLNCEIENIGLIKMQNDEEKFHHLPQDISNGQFVIISENLNGYQLQPRFINTDPDYQGKNAKERVDFFHTTLLDSEFTDLPWKELLAYYNICLEQKIPFSTFDQIRAIGHSSKLLVKAFFFLGVNQVDTDAVSYTHLDVYKRQALDRLTELEITRQNFHYPENYNIEEQYRYCFGIISPTDEAPQEIVLSFDPFQGKYIKT